MFKALAPLLFFICLCGTAAAETFAIDSDPADFPSRTSLFPPGYAPLDGLPHDLGRPVQQSFSLTLVPKLVEMKALYMEKRASDASPTAAPIGGASDTGFGRYLGLTATSSQFDGKLIGEGEVAYSTLGFAGVTDQQRPMMARMTLRGTWEQVGYGALHRTLGSGFISTGGATIVHDRDENQVWGEYDFKIFRWRGTFGELRETTSDTNQLNLTRTASTSLNFTRPQWSALLTSGYSTNALGKLQPQESRAFTQGLSLAYRPVTFLSIEPNFSFKHEWDQNSGARTETPLGSLALTCTPWRDLQLISRASYSRSASEDALKEMSVLNTAASLNWKIGKAFGADQYLSLQVEYRNQRANPLANNSSANVTSMLQWKVLDF
jgi:hypothetical protein